MFTVVALLLISEASFPVHGSGPFGESYSLTQSVTRIQESDSPGVTFVLNVTKALTGVNYQFSFTVRDPTGTTKSTTTQVNTVPSTFTTSVNYPANFGLSLTFVGNYSLTVTQTSPCPTACPAGTGQFRVGLTDALEYQRTNAVSILAQRYSNGENVNITVSKTGSPPILSTHQNANAAGTLNFTWTSIPPSVPVGNYTLSLAGRTVKPIPDAQTFTIDPANLTIPQLSIAQSSLQRSQTAVFRFTATYPNAAIARTGSATIRITEADGTTKHDIAAFYRTTANQFQGSYPIPLNSTTGYWTASIDIGRFDDGYGNLGPSSSVGRGFAVSPAILSMSATTSKNNYTLNGVVAIYSSVITPGNYNFTSGTVTATTFFSSRLVKNPVPLSYDQTRGKWVGSFTINSTDPSGVWIIQINATDSYGNFGYTSISILVILPSQPPPQQTTTFNYLLVLVIVLGAALAILGSWVVYRRGRISRRALKVDLEAVHAEAAKVENNEFFKRVQEQLREQNKSSK